MKENDIISGILIGLVIGIVLVVRNENDKVKREKKKGL